MWLKKDKIFYNLNKNNVTSIYIEGGVNTDYKPFYNIVAIMTYDHPNGEAVKVIIVRLSDEQEAKHYLHVVVRLIQQDDLIVDDLTKCINAYGEQ